jgi:hypothetical protein
VRHGLSLSLPNGLGGVLAAVALVKEFMRLCNAQHKRTYVELEIMLRSGLVAGGYAGLSPAYTT